MTQRRWYADIERVPAADAPSGSCSPAAHAWRCRRLQALRLQEQRMLPGARLRRRQRHLLQLQARVPGQQVHAVRHKRQPWLRDERYGCLLSSARDNHTCVPDARGGSGTSTSMLAKACCRNCHVISYPGLAVAAASIYGCASVPCVVGCKSGTQIYLSIAVAGGRTALSCGVCHHGFGTAH